ncbi:hypothetical protein BBJ28_00010975 [Nothophytophthora sp. Chile5]|nr:hypothetical protein BBJ28_00010975 [Nothophytophthora sp. Chile5]
MPTYRSLAVLIYREFGVPVVGLRTIEDTTTVFPIDEQLMDGNFLSIFFIGRGNNIAPKIERLTPAVFTRHPDIAPLGINSNQNLRTVTGLLSAAIDHKMPSPFRRMSIGFGNDKRSAAGPDTFMRVNTRARLVSSRGLNLGIFSSRGQDKISPLDRDEDVNENEHENSEAAEQEEYAKDNPEDMGRLDGRRFSRMDLEDSMHSTPDQHYSLGNSLSSTSAKPPAKPIIPVIALSPAELIAKATTPRGRFFKDPVVKHLSSPRSQQSTRGRSARESSSNQLTGATSPPSAPVNSEANGPSEAMVEQNGSPNSIGCSVQDGPNLSDLTAAQGPTDEREGVEREGGEREGARLEEGGERVNSMPESALPRPSVVTSGNLRTRIRHLSMCFRREPPPATLANHFVICGTPSNYADFLANLSDLNETVSALVFVTPRTLTEKDFHAHQLHEHLYFVRGSPLSMHVFHVARMFHARSILIMSYCGVEINREQDTDTNMETLDENMADVDAITTHRFISEALQNELSREASNGGGGRPTVPFLVAEMIRPSNVKFLIDRSGSLYDEKSTVNVARERELLKDLKYLDSSFFCPLYASGHIYFSNFMDALMGSCSNQQLLIEMVTQLVISGNMSMNMPNRVQRSRHRLTQIPAPTRYHFRPYALLVEGLLHNEVRCVLHPAALPPSVFCRTLLISLVCLVRIS